MKRRKLFAANWKMNLTAVEARTLITALRAEIDPNLNALAKDRDLMIAPPFTALAAVAQALAGSTIALGAQNMHYEAHGAFTGEISASMLKEAGVRCVILGHSERRRLFHENGDSIGRKAAAASAHGLAMILCVGETAGERDAGRTLEVVLQQLAQGLERLPEADAETLAIAYEPVWAIGTGRNAAPEQVQIVHRAIRDSLAERYGRETGESVRILYGGSVTPENVDSLISRPDIDGALVGSASLNAASFARIVKAASRL